MAVSSALLFGSHERAAAEDISVVETISDYLLGYNEKEDSGFSVAGVNIDTAVRGSYRFWDFGDEFKFEHKTHPDDADFLEGSPGSTAIDKAHMLGVDLEAFVPIGNFEPYAGAGALFVFGRDEHQNDNDFRPSGRGSMVYSDIFPAAPHFNSGVRFYPFKDGKGFLEKLSLSGEVEGAYFEVEHGWNRFGKDDRVKDESKFFLNAGAIVGYKLYDNIDLNLGYHHGLNSESNVFTIGFRVGF